MEYPSVWDAFDIARRRSHFKLVRAATLKLKEMGCKIIFVEHPDRDKLCDASDYELRYEICPKLGLYYGEITRHDIVGVKDDELVIVEVATSDRIVQQVEEAKKKARDVIIVLNIDSSEGIRIWSKRELERYLVEES